MKINKQYEKEIIKLEKENRPLRTKHLEYLNNIQEDYKKEIHNSLMIFIVMFCSLDIFYLLCELYFYLLGQGIIQ